MDNPSTWALFLTLKNAALAAFSLLYKMWVGEVEVELISIPRYLNVLHYCNLYLLTYKAPEHYTNMTSVLLVLMTRSFSLQKEAKTEMSFCSLGTLGAISTTSSAKANIKRLKQATVYSLHYYLV